MAHLIMRCGPPPDIQNRACGSEHNAHGELGLLPVIGLGAQAVPDYARRWRAGAVISTAFAESTVNLIVSKHFAKKQQMQWSRAGAHRLLQTRTRTLDGILRAMFATWYPAMAFDHTENWSRPPRPDHLPRFGMLP